MNEWHVLRIQKYTGNWKSLPKKQTRLIKLSLPEVFTHSQNYTNFYSTLIIPIHQVLARCYLKYMNYRPLKAGVFNGNADSHLTR